MGHIYERPGDKTQSGYRVEAVGRTLALFGPDDEHLVSITARDELLNMDTMPAERREQILGCAGQILHAIYDSGNDSLDMAEIGAEMSPVVSRPLSAEVVTTITLDINGPGETATVAEATVLADFQ